MNITKAFARHLEFLGYGELDKNIFWGKMPDTDSAGTDICVYSTDSGYPGSPDGARLQIITRSRSTKAAYDTSQAIAEEIAEYSGYLHGDGPDTNIEVVNASAGLGEDERKRALFSTNVTVTYCDGE